MPAADFAAAQQRVLARRQARETAARTQAEASKTAQRTTAQRFIPRPLQPLASLFGAAQQTIGGREGTRPAYRVGQVDAELLDEELLTLLRRQVGEGLKHYGAHLMDDWTAEIQLALRAILFKLSVWDHNASYGAALQNLRYADARTDSLAPVEPQRWQKILYGLVSVGGRYGWTKWEDYLLDIESGYDEPSRRMRLFSRLSNAASTMHSFAASASFIVFLYNGRYRTILDRVLRLRLVPKTNSVSHQVSFEYLNRQLVWHAFTEFLLFLLPLVGISRWKRWIARAWRKTKMMFQKSTETGDEELKTGGEFGFLPERTCAICYQDQNPTNASESEVTAMSARASGVVGSAQTDITNPYETIPCGCIYCYVCLAQRLEAEDGEGWACLRCGEIVQECKPWSGDVVEEVRPSSGKSVTFADEQKPLENIEPRPVEDQGSAELEAEIEKEIQNATLHPLEESIEWAEINNDETFGFDEAGESSNNETMINGIETDEDDSNMWRTGT